MEGIQLSVEKTGIRNSISIIKVGGYIDTTTSSELEHALSSLLKSGSYNIIIDLGNVDYVSSAGWGIFISEIKGIRERGGDLKLVRMIPEVYEVFELLEFHYILKAFESIDDAIKDFERTLTNIGEMPQIVDIEKEIAKPINTPTAKTHIANVEAEKIESLEDKVRKIIAMNPDISTVQIVRTLNTPFYGSVRIGWFSLWKILKTTGLDSKKKRQELAKKRS